MNSPDIPEQSPKEESTISPRSEDPFIQAKKQAEAKARGIDTAFEVIKTDAQKKGVDISEEDILLQKLRAEIEAEDKAAEATDYNSRLLEDVEVEEGSLEDIRNKVVDRHARVFGLSSEVVSRVKGIPIVEDDRKFKEERMGYVQDYMEAAIKRENAYELINDDERKRIIERQAQEEADIKITERDFDEEMRRSGGSYIQRADSKETIFIRYSDFLTKEETIAHEALHALSSRGFKGGTGFREGPGEVVFIKSKGFNEATTELLRVVSLMEGADFFDVIDAIYDETVQFGYKTHTTLLATILEATHGVGGSPITFQTVADFYFGHIGRSAPAAQDEFKELLIKSIPKKHKDLIEKLIPEKFTDLT